MSSSDNGDQEIYGGYSVDDEDQPGNIDDLGDPAVADELDRGYSPPEKYSAGQGYGNTPWEEEHRESIDQRIAQEEPDVDPYAETDDDDGSARPTARSATSAPAAWSTPTRASARTRRRTWSATTSGSTTARDRPRRPRCTSSRTTGRTEPRMQHRPDRAYCARHRLHPGHRARHRPRPRQPRAPGSGSTDAPTASVERAIAELRDAVPDADLVPVVADVASEEGFEAAVAAAARRGRAGQQPRHLRVAARRWRSPTTSGDASSRSTCSPPYA